MQYNNKVLKREHRAIVIEVCALLWASMAMEVFSRNLPIVCISCKNNLG